MFNLDDAIDPKTEIIEVAFSNLDTDIGAIYKDEVLSALAGVYANPDKSQWQRIACLGEIGQLIHALKA
jgi:hypothetical protein